MDYVSQKHSGRIGSEVVGDRLVQIIALKEPISLKYVLMRAQKEKSQLLRLHFYI